jgi:hypothetical protein
MGRSGAGGGGACDHPRSLRRSGSSGGGSRGSRRSRDRGLRGQRLGRQQRAQDRAAARAGGVSVVILEVGGRQQGQAAGPPSSPGAEATRHLDEADGKVVELQLTVREPRERRRAKGPRIAAAAAARVASVLALPGAFVSAALSAAGADAPAAGDSAAPRSGAGPGGVPSPMAVLSSLRASAAAGRQELEDTIGAALAQPLAAVRAGFGFFGSRASEGAGAEPGPGSSARGSGSGGGGSAWLLSPSGLLGAMSRSGPSSTGASEGGRGGLGGVNGTPPAPPPVQTMGSGPDATGAAAAPGEAQQCPAQSACEVAARAAAAAIDAAAAAEAAAVSGRGPLGDGSPFAAALVGSIADVVAHGLRRSPGQRGGWFGAPLRHRPYAVGPHGHEWAGPSGRKQA